MDVVFVCMLESMIVWCPAGGTYSTVFSKASFIVLPHLNTYTTAQTTVIPILDTVYPLSGRTNVDNKVNVPLLKDTTVAAAAAAVPGGTRT